MKELLLSLFLLAQAFVGLIFYSTTAEPAEILTEVAPVVRVIDGDTIVVMLNDVEESVRYIGIDTPEIYHQEIEQCYSAEAKMANEKLVAGKEVTLITDKENRDKYGRLLRYVYVEDIFVNEKLLENGFARVMTIPPNTEYWEEFLTVEKTAQANNIGLWANCMNN